MQHADLETLERYADPSRLRKGRLLALSVPVWAHRQSILSLVAPRLLTWNEKPQWWEGIDGSGWRAVHPGMQGADAMGLKKVEARWTKKLNQLRPGGAASVQSPETAFFLLSFDGEMPETELMAKTALEALEAEYPGLESDERLESIAGQPAFGYDIRFFSFDLTNTCWARSFIAARVRSWSCGRRTTSSWSRSGPVLQAMAASLRVEED